GLTYPERRLLRLFMPLSYFLLTCGVSLALFVVGPKAIRFLLGFGGDGLRPMMTVNSVLQFLLFLGIAFGLTFEMPIVILVLGRLGIVNYVRLWGYRKMVYLGIVVAAAVLTPGPDIISQLFLAIPMVVLFEFSLLLLLWQEKLPTAKMPPHA
ncbi:MAG: twin-arginine translocase subunit TatC, partial [Elusimicrobia bacterium]|nr:twin-arginine translocase subunit TatC [Elusimicrobiota bacterium]